MVRQHAVLIALALAVAPACKTKVDGAKANALVESMLAGHGISVTAACPGGLPAKRGARFQCAAEVKDTGQRLTIDVEMTDDKGTANAQLVGTIVDTATYLPKVKEELGVPAAKITCASKMLIVTQAEPANCEITDGTNTRKLQIVERDPAAHLISWRMADADGNFPPLAPVTP